MCPSFADFSLVVVQGRLFFLSDVKVLKNISQQINKITTLLQKTTHEKIRDQLVIQPVLEIKCGQRADLGYSVHLS